MNRLVSLLCALGMAATLGACQSMNKPMQPAQPAAQPAAKPVDPASLYARLGQRAGIEAVSTDFVGRMAKDRRVNKRFANTNANAFIASLTDQICEASGGPCVYKGKDMKAAHAGMKISNREWNITVAHLQAAMRAKKVKMKEQREVLALLGPMKGDIVGQ